jgi:hypothetical protein
MSCRAPYCPGIFRWLLMRGLWPFVVAAVYRPHLLSPAGTMQLLWGARASRPLFSASRRRPLLPRDDAPFGELRGALSQSAGRRLERPGRSRSPISTESFRPGSSRRPVSDCSVTLMPTPVCDGPKNCRTIPPLGGEGERHNTSHFDPIRARPRGDTTAKA